MVSKNRFVLRGKEGKRGVAYDWVGMMCYIRDLFEQGKTDEQVLEEIKKYDFTAVTLRRYKAFVNAKSFEEARKIWDVSAKAFPDAIKEFLPQFKDKLPKEEQVIEKEDVGKAEEVLGKNEAKQREAKASALQKQNGKKIIKSHGKTLVIPLTV